MTKDKDQQTENRARFGPIEWMRWIPATILAVVFLIAVIISGRIILVPLLISLALAYLLAPLVSWFERRGWARPTSVLLALTSACMTLILILIFILPGFWSQLTQSYSQAKVLLSDQSRVEPLLNRIKQASPPVYDLIESQINRLKGPGGEDRLSGIAFGWLKSGLFELVDLTTSLLDLLLIPFFIYYLLADYGAMRSKIDILIPPRYRLVMADLIGQVNHVLSSYVRSQLLIALVMGVLYSLGFLALRVPMAITIGMLSGLLNFVPYLGTLSGLALSIGFVALDGAGIGRMSGVLAVFVIVQSIEGYYLTPKFLGSSLNLHPLWVLVGLMIGGNLFGLLGIILAVPAIAIAKVVMGFLENIYRDSDFYRRAGLHLLTEMGQPVDFNPRTESSPLILEDPQPERPRRAIITTGELRSRKRDNKPPSEE